MSKIFVRERRDAAKGTRRPRFAIVAVAETDLKVFQPRIRRAELEKLASEIGADIVYLPRGENSTEEREQGGRRRRARGSGAS